MGSLLAIDFCFYLSVYILFFNRLLESFFFSLFIFFVVLLSTWLSLLCWFLTGFPFPVSIVVNASPLKSDFGHCERVVKKWAFSSLDQEVKEDRHTLRDLMFFLHVPRTGGRTYFHW